MWEEVIAEVTGEEEVILEQGKAHDPTGLETLKEDRDAGRGGLVTRTPGRRGLAKGRQGLGRSQGCPSVSWGRGACRPAAS